MNQMRQPEQNTTALAHKVKRLSRLELPGAGQVVVEGNYAYVGHIPNKEQLGTSILDVSDPRQPRVVSQSFLDDPQSHSHKARVVGDMMIVNSERNPTAIGRRAEQLPQVRSELRAALGRAPSHAEIAAKLGVAETYIPLVEEAERNPYDRGGFKIYDVSDKSRPKLVCFQKTGGGGVHRFDMDQNYAYISHGVVVPAATPPAVITRLNRDIMQVLGMAELRDRFAALGVEVSGGTPREFTEYIARETPKWAAVVKNSGARAD